MHDAKMHAFGLLNPLETVMAMITVRNLPDDIHRALRARAAAHRRSTEAEVRAILADAVMPETRPRMGDALAGLGRTLGLSDTDLDAIARHDTTPAAPVSLE